MSTKHILLLLICMLLGLMLCPLEAISQAEMVQSPQYDILTFHYDLVNVASPDSTLSRLQVYFKIAFDELQFIRSEEQFLANYEVSVVIYDKKGNQIDGKIEEEAVNAEYYDLTNSRTVYSVSYIKFDLEPGFYKISITLADRETRNTRTIKDEFVLRDFSKKKLSISDLALVRNVIVDSLGVKSFRPDVANCIKDLSKDLYGYFEIYSRTKKNEQFAISYTIKDMKENVIIENHYRRRKDGPRTLEFFSLQTSELSQGKYLLKLRVKSGFRSATIKKPFFVRWANMPSTISDIALAIRQVKYIAEKKEFDKLKNVTAEERLKQFEQFWKNHDPTPGTDKNESMDEFYRRVQFANENFTVFRDGWRTDMGMIYIIFGPPSDIERHPFDLENKPYEYWYYHDINKQFIFMDQSGFGEYRLLTTGWEAWRNSIKSPW